MCNEEKLGYIIGKQEMIEKELAETKQELLDHMHREEEKARDLDDKLDRILRELSYYRIAMDMLKTLFYAGVGLVVFYFDKILTWIGKG
jgi:hypothetical protein